MLLLKTIGCDNTDYFWSFFWWLLAAFLLGLLIPWILRMLSGGKDDDDDWKGKYKSLDGKYNVLVDSQEKLQNDFNELKKSGLAGGKATDGIDWKSKYEDCVSSKSTATYAVGSGVSFGGASTAKEDLAVKAAEEEEPAEVIEFMSGANEDTGERDDLTKVEGIGPKIQEHINAGGIFTYKHLSLADVNYLRHILDNAGPAYKVHQPGTWPAQSKMANEGRWAELEAWQKELKGGK